MPAAPVLPPPCWCTYFGSGFGVAPSQASRYYLSASRHSRPSGKKGQTYWERGPLTRRQGVGTAGRWSPGLAQGLLGVVGRPGPGLNVTPPGIGLNYLLGDPGASRRLGASVSACGLDGGGALAGDHARSPPHQWAPCCTGVGPPFPAPVLVLGIGLAMWAKIISVQRHLVLLLFQRFSVN